MDELATKVLIENSASFCTFDFFINCYHLIRFAD